MLHGWRGTGGNVERVGGEGGGQRAPDRAGGLCELRGHRHGVVRLSPLRSLLIHAPTDRVPGQGLEAAMAAQQRKGA